MAALAVGDTAPDFDLPVSNTERVQLTSLLEKGPVVLLVYVFDFSPGWTNELSEFGKRIEAFTELGLQVFGVSVDAPWSHLAYRRQLNLPDELVLLSDFNRDFGRAYGLLYTQPSGLRDVLRRTVLLIDRDGKLVYRWDQPDPPRLPSADEVIAAAREHFG